MYYAYVLLKRKNNGNSFYAGFTDNIEKRLREHKTGNTKTTRSADSLEIIYYEACVNKTDAIKRELQLKTGFGRGHLKRRLENYLKEITRA